MSTVASRYYRASGAVPFGGILMMLSGGFVCGLVLSILYALLCWYNPFVYLTFLATFFFGGGIGWSVQAASRAGQVRNKLFNVLVSGFLASLSMYLCWVWFVAVVDAQVVGFANASLLFAPDSLFTVIDLIAANGIWEMFGATPKGGVLYTLWLIEAGLVVGTAVLVSTNITAPYCEYCRRWTTETAGAASLQHADHAGLRQQLEDGQYEILDTLREGADPLDGLCVTTYHCDECTDSSYITVKKVRITFDDKGNEQRNEEDVITHLHIPDDVRQKLLTEITVAAESVDSEAGEAADPVVADESSGEPIFEPDASKPARGETV